VYNPDGQIVEEDGEGMSITDPMEADEALLSKSNLFFSWMKKYGVYLLLVAIAFLRGAAYANLLPAWGIIDEEQHLHYIQYLAEEKRLPVADETFLSDEIIQSLFEIDRWKIFSLNRPSSMDPAQMGLEGYSYEAYQPPLYYLVLSPFYNLHSGDVLEKLYFFRWASVGISAISVLVVYFIAQAFTGSSPLALLVGLFYLLIPERTMAVSRLNNDVMLELFACLFLLVSTRSITRGLNTRRALALGLLLGLGVLSKMSMLLLAVCLPFVFFANRHSVRVRRWIIITTTMSLVLILPLAIRNLWLYADPTGFGAVSGLLNFAPPAWSLSTLAASIWQTITHFWVVWWQGARSIFSPTPTLFYLFMLVLLGASVLGWRRLNRKLETRDRDQQKRTVLWMYLAAIALYLLFIIFSYWRGQIPVIQGRFLLPIASIFSIMFITGLRHGWRPFLTIPAAISALIFIDAALLFGNLMIQYYLIQPITLAGRGLPENLVRYGRELLETSLQGKPAFIARTMSGAIHGYFISVGLSLGGLIIGLYWLRRDEG
jgi:4-amino-4-deoxy-L-arabinose transferase-like glycosyltransferase